MFAVGLRSLYVRTQTKTGFLRLAWILAGLARRLRAAGEAGLTPMPRAGRC
jgi:hypothetical protein